MDFFYFWWPFLIAGPFLIPEAVAWLDKRPGGTFTRWVRDCFALWRHTTQRHWRIRRLLFGAFWTCLTGHFFVEMGALWTFLAAGACVWPVVYHYKYERRR